MNTARLLALLLVGSALATACSEASPEPASPIPLGIEVNVASDPGHGTANAEILSRGTRVAVTDEKGHATLTLRGNEGDSFELTVRCPAGFDSPGQPLSVAIRRLAEGSRAPHFDARCAPLVRTAIVGIRADGGANLPILHLGREVGRTDSSGGALVVLSVKPGEHVSLVVDTSAAGPATKLLPESPTLTFVAKDVDDFISLDQRFEEAKPAVRASHAVVRAGPSRI